MVMVIEMVNVMVIAMVMVTTTNDEVSCNNLGNKTNTLEDALGDVLVYCKEMWQTHWQTNWEMHMCWKMQ